MPASAVPPPRRAAALLTALALAAAAAGCGTVPRPSRGAPVTPPAAGARFDYQIGGGYPPAKGVRVVSRDRTDRPAPGVYSVCYVNAFQAQPDAAPWWQRHHPDLLLRDRHGAPVVDEDWHEVLLDVSTAARRTALAAVVGRWIDDCAERGFQAVEPDNLDSFERSRGLLTAAQNAAYARLLVTRAHAAGLAVAQKNTAELLPRHTAIGFDFAVAEECGEFDECGDYAAAYADRVLVVAYTAADFGRTCRRWGGRLSVVLRDRDVMPAGERGHVFRTC
ncbi:endo alpha-1,4 polygalactosaminidase [Streptomyces sp. NPDC088354]|uniref:endo alpha-1,4 polygalactosaminidase n=1 Tax=Streptomyces sp. NPDC088354 TaxID=3365856 RepID=UPI0038285605